LDANISDGSDQKKEFPSIDIVLGINIPKKRKKKYKIAFHSDIHHITPLMIIDQAPSIFSSKNQLLAFCIASIFDVAVIPQKIIQQFGHTHDKLECLVDISPLKI